MKTFFIFFPFLDKLSKIHYDEILRITTHFKKGTKIYFSTITMRLAHVMIRVNNLDESIEFYSTVLNMKLLDVKVNEEGRYTIAFLGYGEHKHRETCLELTYNWDTHHYDLGNGFGHLAVAVPDVYIACEEVTAKGGTVTRAAGPLKGRPESIIAFIKDPNGYSIELVTQR